MKGLYIYDTESDGLAGKSIDPSEHMTKFHVLLFKEYGVDNWHVFLDHLHEGFREAKDFLDKKEVNLTYHKLDEVIKWLKSEPKGVACQNQFGFDLLALTNQYGTEFDYFPERIDDHPIKMYDTLSMSRALYPDRQLPFGCPSKIKDPNGGKAKTVGPHSLEAWGYKLANLKVAIEDWRNLPLWKYCDRVFEDVLINELQFQALVKESKDGVDKGVEWRIPLQRCSQADYLMVVQEQQGVVFDQEKAWKLLEKVDAHMREIEGQVEPNLPLRQVPENQRPTFPKEPFGKDGEISHWGWKYAENVLGYKLNLEYFEHIGPPKTAFKKDGSLSKNGFNYCTKMGIADESLMPDFIREQLRKSNTLKPLEEDEMANLRKQLEDKFMPEEFLWTPMKISNQDDIKNWLVKEQGWRPTLWNTTDITKGPDKKALPDSEKEDKCWEYIQKRKDGIYAEFYRGELDDLDIRTIKRDDSNFKKLLKKGRMLPTTPKFKDERGKLCPMLELIQGDMAKLIVTWLSCRNRRSVVKSADETKTTGWLNHPRLKIDGRLPARYTGLTPTFRRKHNIVANVPSTDALYGKEMRDLYTVPKGFWQMGIDGSNLEGMVAAEAAYPFDGGAYYKSLSGDPHCYTGDTQILTKERGWVRFDELKDSEHVAQYFENGSVDYVKPSEVVRMSFKGKMFKMTSRDMDLDVTFNHRMVVKDVRNMDKVKIVTAENYSTTNGSLRNVVSGKFLNGGLKLDKDFIRLLVSAQADGCLKGDSLRFSFRKDRKMDQFESILEKFNGTSYVDRRGDYRVEFPNVYPLLEDYMTRSKIFTNKLLDLDSDSRECFLNEVAIWDGWSCKNNHFYGQVNDRHSSVDLVHTLANLAGRKTYICYVDESKFIGEGKVSKRLTFSKSEDKSKTRSCLSVKKSSYQYEGKVYCVTVPTGMILVKRNDKILVSGNTTNAKAYSIAAGREVTRSGGKAITYGIMYGAQAPKIGVMLGVSKEVGQRVIEAFWNTNYGLKGCKEYLEKFWKSTGKRYILGFDKRKIYIRSQHSLLNAYLQSGGAIGMDIAGILWHKRAKEEGLLDKGVARTIYYHKLIVASYSNVCRKTHLIQGSL